MDRPGCRLLWKTIPDPIELISSVAFAGIDPTDVATARAVLEPETLSKALDGVTDVVHLATVFRTTDEAGSGRSTWTGPAT